MTDIYLIKICLSFLVSFAVAIYAIPPLISIAIEKKLYDIPNPKKVHEKPIPRLGGLSIYIGFMTSLTLLGKMTNGIQEILAASVIIFFIGLKDDLIPISALKKFLSQLLAAGIVMFMGNIRITSFHGILGIYDLDAIHLGLSYIITFITIIGITNAINLIDGINGLAGSLIVIISVTFGLSFLFNSKPDFAILSFALAGGVLGFLRYNLKNASIFMGDTGSLLCGFLLSIEAIEFVELRHLHTNPQIAIAILIIPIFDALRVFCLRIFKGLSPFLPNKDHIYHRMLDAGLSHLQSTLILSFFTLMVIFFVFHFNSIGYIYLFLFLILFLTILYSIVFYLRYRKCGH